jgi:predicted DNA-binding transcriptional regulator AlpA
VEYQTNKKRYLRVIDLRERWHVSQMFIERRLREPDFPKAIRLPGSRIRLFDETEIEAYEKACVVTYGPARLGHEREQRRRPR